MKDESKKFELSKGILLLFVLGNLGILIFYVFYCSRYLFNSDMATKLLIASEQIRTGQLFPEGWHNTTGISVSIWELLIIPFMSVISNWILCRQIVVFIQIIILISCIAWFFKCGCKNWRLASGLCLIFMTLPIGQYDQSFYDASYMSVVIYLLLTNILIIRILDSSVKSKKRTCVKYYGFLAFVIFQAGYGSLRSYAILMMPAIFSIVLYYWLE